MPPSRRSTYLLLLLALFLLANSSCLVQQPTAQPAAQADTANAAPANEADQVVAITAVTETTVTTLGETAAVLPAPTTSPIPLNNAAAAVGAVIALPVSEGTPAPAALYGTVVEASAPVAVNQAVMQYEPVTAGVTDDNEKWRDYLAYRVRHQGLWVKERDVSERYVIRVVDQHALPLHDALVEVFANDQLLFTGRTDAGGQVFFHPRALDSGYWQRQTSEYRVKASKGWVAQSQTFARTNGQTTDEQWTLTLADPPRRANAQLDLLFLIDATGSMGDEIDKLKASMAGIADQIARLPEQPDIRYGLVAYRDRGDEFVVRPYDFTYDLGQFQQTLAALRADGGGDTPESLNEALHRSIHGLSWRTDDAVRMVLLVADAPPHLDYGDESFSYDTDMIEAVRRGIKLFPVGASGLEADGEYIFRQLAQFTGGKFVFLTYADGGNPASGPGTETSHDVDNYSVDTLDRLVVRLVREELAKLVRITTGAQNPAASQPWPQPSPLPTPTPAPQPQPVSCTVDLVAARHDCDRISALQLLEWRDNHALYQLTVGPFATGYARARFDITYSGAPSGWSVNLGDSISNQGSGGDMGTQSNDAEVQILAGDLLVYGNDNTPIDQTGDGRRLLSRRNDAVRAGETISLEVSDQHLGISAAGGIEVFDSPYLFALNGQPDREGEVNYSLYLGFNRSINGGHDGTGVARVIITLIPAQRID
ncbi:MAG: VWA domain-containing protein [Caldilinea sp. CFX5]|nr:VWA domain-containing protein [Caldilinea sp. CFX5]